jgi:hypothetical protein
MTFNCLIQAADLRHLSHRATTVWRAARNSKAGSNVRLNYTVPYKKNIKGVVVSFRLKMNGNFFPVSNEAPPHEEV